MRYVTYIKRAHDPLSATVMDMWAVMEEGGTVDGASYPGSRHVCYCTREQEAHHIRDLLIREDEEKQAMRQKYSGG